MKNLFNFLILLIAVFPLLFSCSEKTYFNSHENKIAAVQIVTHTGHLHAEYFHSDPYCVSSPWLKKQKVILEKIANKWIKKSTNITKGDAFVCGALGTGKKAEDLMEQKKGDALSLELKLYDKEGNILNDEYTQKANTTQIFFTVSNCFDNKTKQKKHATINDLVYQYTYRDTEPATQMYSTEGVSLLNENEAINGFENIGMKGYFILKVGRVSYNLNIHIVEWLKGNKPKNLKFNELPENNRDVEITSFSIPINVLFTHPWTAEDEILKFSILSKYYGGFTTKELMELENRIDPESADYKM